MKLLESLKNSVSVELTANDPKEIVAAWRVMELALNATKERSEIEEALAYTKSQEFIKCVALPNNYSTFIQDHLDYLFRKKGLQT